MSLIKCPNCENKVSDRAERCPSCGFFLENNIKEQELKCEECGAIITPGEIVCSSCGCPVTVNIPQKVEVTSVKIGSTNKKQIIIIAIIIGIIITSVVGGILISNSIKETQAKEEAARIEAEAKEYEENYKANLKRASILMLTGASEAESVGGLIHDVWYNTIYEESDIRTNKYTLNTSGGYTNGFNSDFNTSLAKLFADEDFQEDVESITENQNEVKEIMKELTNPPDEFKEAYGAIKSYYDAYLEFTNLAIDPNGSLSSFTNAFNEGDAKVLNCYNAMEIYLD